MKLPEDATDRKFFHAAVQIAYELRRLSDDRARGPHRLLRSAFSQAYREAEINRQLAARAKPVLEKLRDIVDLLRTDDDLREFLALQPEQSAGITEDDVAKLRKELANEPAPGIGDQEVTP